MAFLLPAQLAGTLSVREAVADAVYRAVLAFDLADEALLLTAVTEDIWFEMPGTSAKGIQEIKTAVFDRVSKLTTTHFTSNIRISIESDSAATLTCSALAQHVRPGKEFEPGGGNKFTSGGLYLCEVIRIGDLWKIKRWNANFTWVDGDSTVMAGH